jgi:uncharacterized protein (TIGR02231 family)
MRKTLLLLSALFFVLDAKTQDEEKIIETTIQEVTVFRNSAQVFREGKVNLEAGLNKIIIPSVSPVLNQATIQASGYGNFTILDVKYYLKPIYKKNDELEPEIRKLNQQIKILEDSVFYMKYDVEKLAYSRNILDNEKKMILENGILKKREDTNSIEVLDETAVYLRTKLNQIESDLVEVKIKEYELNKIYSEKSNRLTKLKNYRNQLLSQQKSMNNTNIPQVILTCFAEKPTNGSLKVSYLVNGCSWTPAYDLKVNGTNKPVKLTKRALVYQNSREDWNNVKLTLSSHTPNFSRTKPILYSWNLDNPRNLRYDNYAIKVQDEVLEESMIGAKKDKERDLTKAAAMSAADFTEQSSSIVFTEYKIKLPFTIPSDGQQHTVPIADDEINTSFVYYLVPKIDPKAYVIANLTDWQDKKLQPANANLYFQNTYMGQSYINPNIISDTIEVAFGYDDNIVSERKKVDEKKASGILDKTKEITIQLIVKNNNPYAVNTEIVDQIPITNNSKIKIVLTKADGGELDEKTGLITWKEEIPANSSKTIKFSYTVKGD